MQRQLPQITHRLNTTLDKLRAPGHTDSHRVRAADWWPALQQRYAHRTVTFVLDGETGAHELPAEMFDSVADNLLENALRKYAGEGVEVSVTFAPARAALRVADTGAAIPQGMATQLFSAPVTSGSGLGVGLYHAAKQAAQARYTLSLAENRQDNVLFSLAPTAPPET